MRAITIPRKPVGSPPAIRNTVRRLPDSSIDPYPLANEAPPSGSILHAVYAGDYHGIKRFALNGHIDSRSYHGWTALHVAVMRYDVAAVTTLLSLGANVNYKDKYGWTALHFVALGPISLGQSRNPNILIEAPISSDTSDVEVEPTFAALCKGWQDSRFRNLVCISRRGSWKEGEEVTGLGLAQRLLEAGADPLLGEEITPFDIAYIRDFRGDSFKLALLLGEKLLAFRSGPLLELSLREVDKKNGSLGLVWLLLELGADPEEILEGKPLVKWACSNGNFAMSHLLEQYSLLNLQFESFCILQRLESDCYSSYMNAPLQDGARPPYPQLHSKPSTWVRLWNSKSKSPYLLNLHDLKRKPVSGVAYPSGSESIANRPRVEELLHNGTPFEPDIFGRNFEQIALDTNGLRIRENSRGHPLGRNIVMNARTYTQEIPLPFMREILDRRIKKWGLLPEKDDTWRVSQLNVFTFYQQNRERDEEIQKEKLRRESRDKVKEEAPKWVLPYRTYRSSTYTTSSIGSPSHNTLSSSYSRPSVSTPRKSYVSPDYSPPKSRSCAENHNCEGTYVYRAPAREPTREGKQEARRCKENSERQERRERDRRKQNERENEWREKQAKEAYDATFHGQGGGGGGG